MEETHYRSYPRAEERCAHMRDRSREKCFDEHVTSKRFCDLCRNAAQFSWTFPQLFQPLVQSVSEQLRPKRPYLPVSLIVRSQIGRAWQFSPLFTMNPHSHTMLVSFARKLET